MKQTIREATKKNLTDKSRASSLTNLPLAFKRELTKIYARLGRLPVRLKKLQNYYKME